ncbi:MAG: hypothetical protein BWY37_01473 [Firmicutes bacterium ADurb.Bin262]|nr:MAG: hypothetical protein BWY37_01473 [Firmicutes bacterium ADurb.Bin262]
MYQRQLLRRISLRQQTRIDARYAECLDFRRIAGKCDAPVMVRRRNQAGRFNIVYFIAVAADGGRDIGGVHVACENVLDTPVGKTRRHIAVILNQQVAGSDDFVFEMFQQAVVENANQSFSVCPRPICLGFHPSEPLRAEGAGIFAVFFAGVDGDEAVIAGKFRRITRALPVNIQRLRIAEIAVDVFELFQVDGFFADGAPDIVVAVDDEDLFARALFETFQPCGERQVLLQIAVVSQVARDKHELRIGCFKYFEHFIVYCAAFISQLPLAVGMVV